MARDLTKAGMISQSSSQNPAPDFQRHKNRSATEKAARARVERITASTSEVREAWRSNPGGRPAAIDVAEAIVDVHERSLCKE